MADVVITPAQDEGAGAELDQIAGAATTSLKVAWPADRDRVVRPVECDARRRTNATGIGAAEGDAALLNARALAKDSPAERLSEPAVRIAPPAESAAALPSERRAAPSAVAPVTYRRPKVNSPPATDKPTLPKIARDGQAEAGLASVSRIASLAPRSSRSPPVMTASPPVDQHASNRERHPRGDGERDITDQRQRVDGRVGRDGVWPGRSAARCRCQSR